MEISDQIFGNLKLDKKFSLLESRPLERLRDITIDPMPSQFYKNALNPTLFSNALGTGYLADKLNNEILTFSALLHKVGMPPFHTLAFEKMKEITGQTPAEYTADVIQRDPDIRTHMKKQSIQEKDVKAIFSNESELSPLLNSTLSLSCLDETARLAKAANIKLRYDPEKIVSNISIDEENKVTYSDDIFPMLEQYKKTRSNVMKVFTEQERFVKETMLQDAVMSYLSEKKDKMFFTLSSVQALFYIQKSEKAKALIERISSNKLYHVLSYRVLHTTEDEITEKEALTREQVVAKYGTKARFRQELIKIDSTMTLGEKEIPQEYPNYLVQMIFKESK